MRELSLDEIKQIELRLLKQLNEICIAQGFRYYLAGGTLLGAVRHKGFIPWDDDIDVAMPRPDYERLIDYCRTNEVPFQLVCNKTDGRYGYLFAKIADRETLLVQNVCRRNSPEMGVCIDIFPLDGLADSYDEAKAQLNRTRFARELLVAANWESFSRSKTRSIAYEPIRFAFFCLSRFVSIKKLIKRIEAVYKTNTFDTSKYVACVCGVYRNKEIAEYDVFSECVMLPFEGEYFSCPKKYDEYLSNIYGDYMQLPPIDKRVTHHDYTAWHKQ